MREGWTFTKNIRHHSWYDSDNLKGKICLKYWNYLWLPLAVSSLFRIHSPRGIFRILNIKHGALCKNSFQVKVVNSFTKRAIVHVCWGSRSSCGRCSIRKGVLENFAKFTGKHLCQGLFFNKVAARHLQLYLKKRLCHGSFPLNFAKFPRTIFLQNTCGRLVWGSKYISDPFFDKQHFISFKFALTYFILIEIIILYGN